MSTFSSVVLVRLQERKKLAVHFSQFENFETQQTIYISRHQEYLIVRKTMILNNSPFWRWKRPENDETISDSTVSNGSIANIIASMFGDEELCDIHIKCSDGGNIPVVKSILAARSTVFRQMFFRQANGTKQGMGSTSEKACYEFKEWDSRTMWMIVEYCYTDACSLLSGEPTDDVARMIVHLRVASKKFRLIGLLEKLNQWSWRQLNRHPGLCCALIDEGLKFNDIDETALQTLQIKSRAAMLPESSAVGSGVLSLSKPGLLFILRTIEDSTSHLMLLKVIETWVEFGCEDSPEREELAREAFGIKLANRFVKLSRISPTELAAATKRSKLLLMAVGSSVCSPGDYVPVKISETSSSGIVSRTVTSRRPHSAIGLVKTTTSGI